MKKIFLIVLVATLTVSCGRSKGEQMLYDYQVKNVGLLNIDLDDLDFKIYKIEKLKDIKASDSMKLLKKELALSWSSKSKQSTIDTLSFKYVKYRCNKSINISNKTIKDCEELLSYSYKYKYSLWKNEAKGNLIYMNKYILKVKSLEKYYNKLSKNPEAIISKKYKAKYSLVNPIFGDRKQTFEKVFYTNSSHTKFVKEESENDLNFSQLLSK